MDKEDIVYIHKKLDLDEKEQREILDELQRFRSLSAARWIEEQKEQSKIINKTDLKNHRHLVIEINRSELEPGFGPIGIGLINTRVDRGSNTLKGIRILKYAGTYQFDEITLYLDNYRKNWRAWTRMPKTGQALR